MAKIDGNRKGIRTLPKEPAVLKYLERKAERVAAVAGPGHVVDSGVGKNRARAVVITATYTAQKKEAADRNLTRAFNAARG